MLNIRPPVECNGSSLVTYQKDQIPCIWPFVKHFVDLAQPYGDGPSTDEIYVGLCDGKYQLWTSQSEHCEAAVVTAISHDVCWFMAAGGSNMGVWVKWLPEIISWAKEQGCKQLRIYGRPGWARAAGFDIAYMVRKI